MAEITLEHLAEGLRGWVRGGTPHTVAAVELLIWHEYWLRRSDFRDAAVTQRGPGLIARIGWDEAEKFAQFAPRASSSERAILDIAVALGSDQFRLAGFGHAHKRRVAEAFAAALGQQLAPAPPAHNHPEFIPGDETCVACGGPR